MGAPGLQALIRDDSAPPYPKVVAASNTCCLSLSSGGEHQCLYKGLVRSGPSTPEGVCSGWMSAEGFGPTSIEEGRTVKITLSTVAVPLDPTRPAYKAKRGPDRMEPFLSDPECKNNTTEHISRFLGDPR
ncbi:hypothetical protein DPEC_G00275570 [Dallia pectoralis]|uniref:Uncharacterized protein n=1 Tax=Dallia pectoralis TaxID=75939 RepID=A0ACC2FLC7_DALPE|nr:hypothetical protein DPEC_G00275570 [Dallia pectoralis]